MYIDTQISLRQPCYEEAQASHMERDSENEERHMPCRIPGRFECCRPRRHYVRQKIQPSELSPDYRAIGSHHIKPFPLGGGVGAISYK